MSIDNYPPGHPQGYTQESCTLTCFNCENQLIVTYEIDHATGSGAFIEDVICPECKKDLSEVEPEEWQ